MGHGSYTSADWKKLKTSSRITEKSNDKEIFKRTAMDQRFDPQYINMREARDSEEHPQSTPIIIGLDVTGSMGYLAAQIAKEGLHETMMKLFSTKPVTDPQLMFAALGDVTDAAPLQVTQFESDIRIAEQLMELWLEGGGGDAPEDYELLWYFAAKHTAIDSFDKRGKKGYIFTIGDAECHPRVTSHNISKVFGEQGEDYTLEELAAMACEKYELFHIHITARSSRLPVYISNALGGHMMHVAARDIGVIPELIVSALLMDGGRSMDEVLQNWDEKLRPVIAESLGDLRLKREGSIRF